MKRTRLLIINRVPCPLVVSNQLTLSQRVIKLQFKYAYIVSIIGEYRSVSIKLI